MQNREAFYSQIRKGGRIAEIGVWWGNNAANLLEIAKPANLWLVDCWQKQTGSYEVDPTNDSTDFEACYQFVVERFKNNPEVGIIRKYSLEAAEGFKNAWLDLVYIDANHTYQACLNDLNAYWGKVRRGGYLAGHDYTNRFPWIECKQAVDDFCRANNLQVITTGEEITVTPEIITTPSWIIKK